MSESFLPRRTVQRPYGFLSYGRTPHLPDSHRPPDSGLIRLHDRLSEDLMALTDLQLLARTGGVDPRRYWGQVEVPYKPTYAYEEILATFRDEQGTPASLLAACERLTEVVTEGEVRALAPMTEEERQHYLKTVVRRRPPDPTHVFLSHVPEDQAWADWISRVLSDAGFTVGDARSQDGAGVGVPLRDDTDSKVRAASRTVAVLSATYQKSPQARAVWEAVAVTDPMGSRRALVPIKVGNIPLGHPFSDRTPVDLSPLDEEMARKAVLRAMDAPTEQREHPADAAEGRPRYPNSEPPVLKAPPRNPVFTGREELLEHLRRQLAETGTATLLHGMGGVGKSQLGLEYAHRYRANYDVVWWIEAEFADLALRQFSELAVPLGVTERDSISATADAVRDALRRGEKYDRWLLIFDNATSPESIEKLLVNRPGGHVVITTRQEGWSRIAARVEVDVFTRAESVEHLSHRVAAISADQADAVAEALGDLPLAVDQAAAWFNETGQEPAVYLGLLERQLADLVPVPVADGYPLQIAATFNISIQQLNSPVALRLLQMCAQFGADPISFDLLNGKEMLRELSTLEPYSEETALIPRATQQLNRYALAKVDGVGGSLQVHRLVQAVVRSSMTKKEREAARKILRDVLSGARPSQGDVERPENWPLYNTIWPHLKTRWMSESLDSSVRRLMTDWLRYLRTRGEYGEAVELGERLLAHWDEAAGPDDRWTLHLRYEIANVLRAQGWYERALAIDRDVIARQRATLGDDHDDTLMTAGSLAADLRAVGRVREALDVDRETFERSVDAYGKGNPRALLAANNLAVSMRMAGDCFAALDLDSGTRYQRSGTLGAGHPFTLSSDINLGRDQRSCGDYEASARTLRAAYDTACAHPGMGPQSPAALEAAKALAVTLRRQGLLTEAIELSQGVLDDCCRRFAEDSPETLVVRLGLAGHLAAAERHQEAYQETADLLGRFGRELGDNHPNTLACAVNHGINLLNTGRLAEAHALCEQSGTLLKKLLGAEHPFSMNCMVNLANADAALGRFAQAETHYREAHAALHAKLGGDHPSTLTCLVNLSIVLRDTGRTAEADELAGSALEAISRKLGGEHPRVTRLRNGERVGLELDPHPV